MRYLNESHQLRNMTCMHSSDIYEIVMADCNGLDADEIVDEKQPITVLLSCPVLQDKIDANGLMATHLCACTT